MRLTLSAVVTRMKQIAQGIARELRGGFSLTADPRSFARFAADVFLLRLARLVPLPGRNRERRIRVRGGIETQLSPEPRGYAVDQGGVDGGVLPTALRVGAR